MFIEVENMKINYVVSGEGKDVVILHGWGCEIKTVEPIHKFLEKYFRVYSLDLPGFGASDEPPYPFGGADYARIVDGFLKDMNIESPILIGHSNGGRTSIHLAANRKVNKVILVDSAGVKPKRSLKYYIKVYTYKAMKNIFNLPGLRNHKEEMMEKYKKRVGSSDYKNSSGVMQKTLVKLVNEDAKNLLSQIKVPTLLIWGEKDTATPVSDAKIMEKLIPDAGLVVFKNAGHFSYLDNLNQFLVVVKEFLKNDIEQGRD